MSSGSSTSAEVYLAALRELHGDGGEMLAVRRAHYHRLLDVVEQAIRVIESDDVRTDPLAEAIERLFTYCPETSVNCQESGPDAVAESVHNRVTESVQ